MPVLLERLCMPHAPIPAKPCQIQTGPLPALACCVLICLVYANLGYVQVKRLWRASILCCSSAKLAQFHYHRCGSSIKITVCRWVLSGMSATAVRLRQTQIVQTIAKRTQFSHGVRN